MVKNEDMCSRKLSCDRRTDRQIDGQTSCHGIVRAMHTRRAVKMDNEITNYNYNYNNLK